MSAQDDRNFPIKRPWALELHGQKTGVGAYAKMGAYSGEYGNPIHPIAPVKAWTILISLWDYYGGFNTRRYI